MGTKYSTNATSGYNSTPPADDGTVSEANKVKWSTVKTKLSDPIKTLADTINSELVTHFDNGPQTYTTSQTLGASHYGQLIQVSGSGVTLTLTDAATLTAGWFCDIYSTDTANNVTLARATAADTINASSNNVTILPLETLRVFVNAAATGFIMSRSGVDVDDGPSNAKNYTLTASVAGSALTIALKDKNGNDPNTGSPIKLAFRNVTAATGTYTNAFVTAATSLVISSGSTMGTTSAVPSRLWIVIFNDGGTLRLGAINCSTTTNIYPLADDILASSTAEGGAGAADSAGVIYTGTAVTSKAMRVLGYIESTQTTAGTWATAVSKIQLWNQSMKLPGDTVQTVFKMPATGIGGSATTMPYDNTIPQNTEGAEMFTQAITPTSNCNRIMCDAVLLVGTPVSTTSQSIVAGLFRDSVANALCAVSCRASQNGSDSANYNNTIPMKYLDSPASASAITYKIRAGMSTTVAANVNNDSSTSLFSTAAGSVLVLKELMG